MKGCPKNAFFGLCYAGKIKGISIQTPQEKESKNAEYAILAIHLLDLLRKYPEDLQFPNEIRKPNPKKRQGIQTAHRCNARPFS